MRTDKFGWSQSAPCCQQNPKTVNSEQFAWFLSKATTRKTNQTDTGVSYSGFYKYHLRDSLDVEVPPPLLLLFCHLTSYAEYESYRDEALMIRYCLVWLVAWTDRGRQS